MLQCMLVQYVFTLLFVFKVISAQHPLYLDAGQHQSRLYYISLECGYDSMTLNVKSREPFRGKIYVKNHFRSPLCQSAGDGSKTISLTLSYYRNICGVTNTGNGTFVAKVIIQRHPRIILGDDESYKVICTFPEVLNERRITSNTIEVRGELPKVQPHSLNALSPDVKMTLTDARGYEVKTAYIGQELILTVDLVEEELFGIFATDLISSSSNGRHTLTLVNEEGCSVEPAVFGELKKLRASKDLQGRFKAFKFPTDSIVNFKATIKFCVEECQTAHCTNGTNRGYGRKRRAEKDPLIAEEDNIEHRIPKDVTLFLSIMVVDTEAEVQAVPSEPDEANDVIASHDTDLPIYLPASQESSHDPEVPIYFSSHQDSEQIHPFYLASHLYPVNPPTAGPSQPEIYSYHQYAPQQEISRRSDSPVLGEYVVLSSGIEVRKVRR